MTFIWEMTLGEIITAIILGVTVVIVLLYTKATQRSNEIQEKPILNLYLHESRINSNTQRILKLRNVGNGPAYNIKFFGIEADGYTYYPHFDQPNPILEKDGDTKPIDLWVETPTGGVESYDSILGFDFFLSRLFRSENIQQGEYDNLARTAAVFLITYKGINDKTYYSVFRIYSKIVPLLRVYDLVVEFIANGKGDIDMSRANKLCELKPIMKKNE